MKFIKLTYFVYDPQFPSKSYCTGKCFWLNIDKVEQVVPYEPHKSKDSDRNNQPPSTKLIMVSGNKIEVCETVEEIILKLNK